MSLNKEEISDYRKIFRDHIQEKMILRNYSKALENNKVSNLRTLSHEEVRFKHKYKKYLPAAGGVRENKAAFASTHHRSSRSIDIENSSPRRSNIISQNCPYSFSTWDTMTDPDGLPLVDVYRSEIINSNPHLSTERKEESPASFSKRGGVSLLNSRSRRMLTASSSSLIRRAVSADNIPSLNVVTAQATSPVSIFYSNKQQLEQLTHRHSTQAKNIRDVSIPSMVIHSYACTCNQGVVATCTNFKDEHKEIDTVSKQEKTVEFPEMPSSRDSPVCSSDMPRSRRSTIDTCNLQRPVLSKKLK